MEEKQQTIQLSATELGWLWRPKWFLITRFLAVLSVMAALTASYTIFGIRSIAYRPLLSFAAILLMTNLAYVGYYLSDHLKPSDDPGLLERRLTRFTVVQINADLVILTCMLHYAGGATNPFILFYFFHTILSSILLSMRNAYIEATVVVVLFSGMTLLEGRGVIRHFDLFCPGYHSTPLFIIGMIFAVSSALYLAVYMATSIMERLRGHQVDLMRALEEQRRLEEEKSRFLDVVAHDLKSPIAAIETMVTSTVAVHGAKMTPEVRRIMERIPKRTQDLIHFIQDLLEFSRIRKVEDAETTYKQLNFLPIVTTTVEMYMGDAAEKNIEVSVQSAPDIPTIMGNKNHLERMTANLVSNAIRYTGERGSVTIRVAVQNSDIILTVADTGIGIPEQALPFIFNDFFRADNAKKFTSTGTGLGMSITRAIVEQHGGTISVKSQEGEGTIFTVRLPSYHYPRTR